MNAKVADRAETDMPDMEPQSRGEVVQFKPPRLPYHPAIKERFGIDKGQWKALVEAVFPSAKSIDSVAMVLSYCAARKLDPFKKPVHIVPMYSAAVGGYVETVWPGIAELRTTAFRTGLYAGCDETEFGPEETKEFTGKVKDKGQWVEKTVQVTFPAWCRMTLYREVHGKVGKFVGPKVKWLENYATIGNSDIPNEMWQSRPEGQLEKCAEAAALRKTFPEEIGGDLTAEEMEGKVLAADPAAMARDITPTPPAPPPPPPAPDPEPEAQVQTGLTPPEPGPGPVQKPNRRERQHKAAADKASGIPNGSDDPEAFLKWVDATLAAVSDADDLASVWNDHIEGHLKDLFPPDREEAQGLYSKHEKRLGHD